MWSTFSSVADGLADGVADGTGAGGGFGSLVGKGLGNLAKLKDTFENQMDEVRSIMISAM